MIIFLRLACLVFPTYVGVILVMLLYLSKQLSVPHVCGGDPGVL